MLRLNSKIISNNNINTGLNYFVRKLGNKSTSKLQPLSNAILNGNSSVNASQCNIEKNARNFTSGIKLYACGDPNQKISPCGSRKRDPCGSRKKDPCGKKAVQALIIPKRNPCDKKDPCKKEDPCKRQNPCKKDDLTKTEDPCKNDDPCKNEDPCKKDDPCLKEPPCNDEKPEDFNPCDKKNNNTAKNDTHKPALSLPSPQNPLKPETKFSTKANASTKGKLFEDLAYIDKKSITSLASTAQKPAIQPEPSTLKTSNDKSVTKFSMQENFTKTSKTVPRDSKFSTKSNKHQSSTLSSTIVTPVTVNTSDNIKAAIKAEKPINPAVPTKQQMSQKTGAANQKLNMINEQKSFWNKLFKPE